MFGYTPKPKIVGPTPPEGSDIWWHAQDSTYANYDPWEEFEQNSGSHTVIELVPYVVDKYTPKGVWLRGWIGERFFVLGNAIRQRATPTIELAMQDLIRRKAKHVRMSRMRLKDAEDTLYKAKCAARDVGRNFGEVDGWAIDESNDKP